MKEVHLCMAALKIYQYKLEETAENEFVENSESVEDNEDIKTLICTNNCPL
jgi:hypothetical protein